MAASFNILLGKNIHLEVRQWRRLLVELVVIFIIFTVIALNLSAKNQQLTLDSVAAKNLHFYDEHVLTNLEFFNENTHINQRVSKMSLSYSPITAFTTYVVNRTKEKLGLNEINGYKTEKQMENMFDSRNTLAGIVFNNVDNSTTPPNNLSVTLRFPSLFRTIPNDNLEQALWQTRCSSIVETDKTDMDDEHVDIYIREGFLQLQHSIFVEWVGKLGNASTVPNVTVKGYGFDIENEVYNETKRNYLPLVLCYFAFMYTFINLIRKYGPEIEENLFVHHWKLGYKYLTHWRAHFFISFLRLILHACVIIILTRIRYSTEDDEITFPNTPAYILFLFCLLFNTSMIVTAMVFVTIFRTVKIAVLFAIFWWILNFVLFYPLQPYVDNIKDPVVAVASVMFFNNIFPYGILFLDEINENTASDEIWILMIIIVAIILFQIILLMLVQIFYPFRYIEHTPVNFLCLAECFRTRKSRQVPKERSSIDEIATSWHNFEFGPLTAVQMMQLRNITYYKKHSKKQQLKNISMRIYKGEITVLVGPSNSGKTTLLTIMAGLRVPTLGTVMYEKVEMLSNWKDVRNRIDFSFSDNPFFDQFTAEEMLVYYLRVKMFDSDEQQLIMEIIKWQDAMRPVIPDKDVMVKKMTFEQKRILFLCCVLSCRTRVVLLDEPTGHMHSREQRIYWELLNKYKPDKAIVVATHSIDEAEAIGDRIAILNSGVLKAYGTPFFLKTKYGDGYDLTIVKSDASNSEPITALIQQFIPNVTPENEIGDQIIYKLPADQRPIYQNMLIHLEKESPNLGITHIKVLTTSLSDVYMEIGKKQSNQVISENRKSLKVVNYSAESHKSMQIKAMFYKKCIQQCPRLSSLLFVLLAILMIIFINHSSKTFVAREYKSMEFPIALNSSENILSLFQNINWTNLEIVDLKGQEIASLPVSYVYSIANIKFLQERYEKHLKNTDTVFNNYGGISHEQKIDICYMNEHIFHSAPLALNVEHNWILRALFNQTYHYTTITNKPMPLPLGIQLDRFDNKNSHLIGPITVGCIVPIIISCFIMYVVADRRHHIWILQKIAGMRMHIYWMISMLYDWLVFFVFVLIMLLCMVIFSTVTFTVNCFLFTLLLFAVYGISVLTMTYFIALILNTTPGRAYLISLIIQLVTGLCLLLLFWDIFDTHAIFYYIASIFPTFSLLDGLGNIMAESLERQHCDERCEQIDDCTEEALCELVPMCCYETFFQFADPGILIPIMYLCFSSVLFVFFSFWVLLHRKEKKFHCYRNVKEMHSESYPYDDKDVTEVRQTLAKMDLSEIKKLRYAVDQLETKIPKSGAGLKTISFTTNKYTCVAIYSGHNSGKSHLLKQLIGEHGYCFGDVYFKGTEVKHNLSTFYSYAGYCPQDHGLTGSFTPRQTLWFFAMICGIPRSIAAQRIKDLEVALDMGKYMDKKNYKLRPDHKRKVNIAVAFIAYNKIVFIDEPTRGMPSKTCREIWNVLRYARFCGHVVIVTTSDAAEALALADNVIIFDNGEMWAIGSMKYLMHKFTKGFYLEVKLKRDGTTSLEVQKNIRKDVENLNRFVSFLHEESELISRNDNCLKFYCPVENVVYSYLYGTMEKNKTRLNISEYTIGGGTLGDIMVLFQKKRTHLHNA